MARRRQRDNDEGVNLDSLMDALTNVVAVLILVLILVQAGVTRKVAEFIENLRPATAEQVAEAQQTVANLEQKLARANRQLTETPPTPEMIDTESRRITELEETLEQNRDLLADLDELRKLEAKLRAERDTEEKKTTTVRNEIARLEALLDATPEIKAPPPRVVTIPNSRPIPDNAEIYYALVFGGRVHFIDPFTPLKLFMDEFRQNKSKFRIQRIKRQGADRYIYDQRKIVAHYKGFDFRNRRSQTLTVLPNKHGTRLPIQVLPDPAQGGTSEEQLGQPGSLFERAVNNIAVSRRAVLMFRVNPDSFNTYLLARKMADKAGVPAGWEVRWNKDHRIYIQDVEVRRLEDPPPKKDDGKPQPPKLDPKLD